MAEIYNFFGDIFDYLRETYWDVDFGVYRNFTLGGYGVTLAQIVTAIMLGFILASALMLYERRYIGGFIRGLLKGDAHSEETAKTLSDVGYGKSGILKSTLRKRDSAVRKLVRYTGEVREEAYSNEKIVMKDDIPFEHAAFYIPPDLKNRAETRYDAKGTTVRNFIISVIAALVGGALLIRLLPVFLHFIDNVITWVG